MRDIHCSEKGLTLVECLVMFALAVLILAAVAKVIITSQMVCSLARHKAQAAYVAGQILEQERRLAFSNIVSLSSAAVVLDTNGTYNTTADDFFGNRIITVANIDAYQKKVQVEINWRERNPAGGQNTIREYYATTIANEPQLN